MTHTNDPENPPEIPNLAPPPSDNRRRLRELLSIPERDRSDEQWDEIIELEIQLAPGNRISGNESGGGGRSSMPQGKPGGGGNAQKKHRPRANNNRRLRQNKPPSGGNPPA